MRLYSTLKSSQKGEVSALAIIETFVAIVFMAFLTVQRETMVYMATSAIAASMLLFRTKKSDRINGLFVKNFLRRHSPLNKKLATRSLFLRAVKMAMWFLSIVVIIPILSRIMSLATSIVHNPLVHLMSIGRNWWRLTLCTDSGTLIEIVPGVQSELTNHRAKVPPEYFLYMPTTSFHMLFEEGMASARAFNSLIYKEIFCQDSDASMIKKRTIYYWHIVNSLIRNASYLVATGLAYSASIVLAFAQRASFKSMALLFMPLLWLVHGDKIRRDISVKIRLSEMIQDRVSWFKFAYSIFCIIAICAPILVANFAITYWPYKDGSLSVVGLAVAEYYVPYNGIVTIKMWQIAQLINAAYFLYIFFIFAPRSLRRFDLENSRKFANETKRKIRQYDTITTLLSIYTIACGVTLLVKYAITHQLAPKHFIWFPSVF